jgi:hypothetical protein
MRPEWKDHGGNKKLLQNSGKEILQELNRTDPAWKLDFETDLRKLIPACSILTWPHIVNGTGYLRRSWTSGMSQDKDAMSRKPTNLAIINNKLHSELLSQTKWKLIPFCPFSFIVSSFFIWNKLPKSSSPFGKSCDSTYQRYLKLTWIWRMHVCFIEIQ